MPFLVVLSWLPCCGCPNMTLLFLLSSRGRPFLIWLLLKRFQGKSFLLWKIEVYAIVYFFATPALNYENT
jgi:hypothetical protein